MPLPTTPPNLVPLLAFPPNQVNTAPNQAVWLACAQPNQAVWQVRATPLPTRRLVPLLTALPAGQYPSQPGGIVPTNQVCCTILKAVRWLVPLLTRLPGG